MRVVVSGDGSPVSPETNIIYSRLASLYAKFIQFVKVVKEKVQVRVIAWPVYMQHYRF